MGDLGRVVRKLRDDRRMTQAELARRSGIPESHISRMEHGKYKSGQMDTVRKLAHGLGMDPLDLMEAVDGRQEAVAKPISEIFRDLQSALPPPVRVYASLTDAEKGGRVVAVVYAARKTIDDEQNLFGVQCPAKCLPLLSAKGCTAIIDKRESEPSDGDVVMWEAPELLAGVFHVLGAKRWAENSRGVCELDGCVVYKVQFLNIDVSKGLA